jgi:glycosyltransferase involved in cell wall biosynthesis
MVDHAVLINATTLNKGGALQAVVAFILTLAEEGIHAHGIDWILAVSHEVRVELEQAGYSLRPNIDICLPKSPARSLKSRKILRQFAQTNADAVFTFFGPSYVAFRIPHLCGVADGWVTHARALAYSSLPSLIEKIKMFSLCCYKGFWLRRANMWVVEEEAAKRGLVQRLRLPADKIKIVPNNCASAYSAQAAASQPYKQLNDCITILCFASYYPHKCLELIPQIALQLVSQYNLTNFKFILTVPPKLYAHSKIAKQAAALAVESFIENIGYVAIKDGPALYARCDISLLPSVLETFSATYPESMSCGIPIVTSDLDFARSVCGEAALYFVPLSANSAAHQIALLINNEHLRYEQIKKGFERVKHFPTASEKKILYRNIIAELLDDSL